MYHGYQKTYSLLLCRKSLCTSWRNHLHLRTCNPSRKAARLHDVADSPEVWQCRAHGDWRWYVFQQVSSFVNSRCPSVPWLDVFLLGTQSAHELIRTFMSFPRRWHIYRKCRLSPRARVTPCCRSLVMKRKRFDKILLFLVVNDVDSTVTKLVQASRLWPGTWRSIWSLTQPK